MYWDFFWFIFKHILLGVGVLVIIFLFIIALMNFIEDIPDMIKTWRRK
jgi:hypothetical protein